MDSHLGPAHRCVGRERANTPHTILLQRFNATLTGYPPRWSKRNITQVSDARRHCMQEMVTSTASSSSSPPSSSPVKCADYVAGGHAGVRLMLGVATGPSNWRRRNAIRQTWMRWPAVGRSVVVCFVVGRRQVPNATLAYLDAEAAKHRDLLFLPSISDGCVKMVSIGKAHAFWARGARIIERNRAADGSLPPAMLVKADDDSFVHVPLVERHLTRLSCVRRLYLGAIAFTGYQPRGFSNCGFAWGGDGAYHKYGCERGGAHPPYPFALGQLQALSSDAAHALAAS